MGKSDPGSIWLKDGHMGEVIELRVSLGCQLLGPNILAQPRTVEEIVATSPWAKLAPTG